MTETLCLMLALVTGLALGAMFFGGLWWTVQKGVSSQQPGLWFLGSLLLRTGVILVGFYFVSHGHLSRFGLCLFGFVVARVILVKRLTQAPAEEQTPLEKETPDAP